MLKHFKHLDGAILGRMALRRIDPERSYEALIAECLVSPPPALLRDLAVAPVLTELEIDHAVWPGRRSWKRCN